MKKLSSRILSLSLCLLMLSPLLPMGSLPSRGLTLDNYETDEEFVISDLSDWNTVASGKKTFKGKTIKLGADLDAEGQEIPTLLSKTFKGTFDGQGYTIRNFTANGALLAAEATGNVTIKNLNVENGTITGTSAGSVGLLLGNYSGSENLLVRDCSLQAFVSISDLKYDVENGSHVGGVIGSLSLEDGAWARLENLNLNLTVKNQSTRRTSAWQSAGGVLGIFESLGRSELTLRAINLEGAVTSGTQTTAGGMIGSVFSIDIRPERYAGGSITISNCQTTASVTSSADMPDLGVGGVIGAFGVAKEYCGDNCVYEGTLAIDNCLIGGTIAQTHIAEQLYACGGIIGTLGYGDAEIRVDHSLITASFPSNSLSSPDGRGAGLIVGQSCNLTKSSLFINNTVTTMAEPYHLINAVSLKSDKNHETAFYPWLNLNGVNLGSQMTEKAVLPAIPNTTDWYYVPAFSDGSVQTVLEGSASQMIKKDETGFLTRIRGQISAIGVQDNVADDAQLNSGDIYAIRLIATSPLTLSDIKFNVIIKDADTQTVLQNYTEVATSYDKLFAYHDDGTRIRAYAPSDFGASNFFALTVNNVLAGKSYTFEFTPEFKREDGVTVTGETISVTYDQNGQNLTEKNSLDVLPLPQSSPTIRVLSSNALAHAATNAGEGGVNSATRLQYLADCFLFYHPDFIGMQEMQEQNNVNNLPYNMQTKLLTLIGSEYSMVDFSDKVSLSKHWTPMFYRTDRWTVIESDIQTDIVNDMHRWQWAVYRSKTDPNLMFIHVNLHLTPVRPEEYAEVSQEVVALSKKYPDVPIAVSGDHNINLGTQGNHPSTFETLIGQSSLQNSVYLTENNEALISTCSERTSLLDQIWLEAHIDHIMVTNDTAKVLKHRVIRNIPMGKASDHYAIYADIVQDLGSRSNGSKSDGESGTVIP